MFDQIDKFISLHSLGTLVLIVCAVLGATQFAKLIARAYIGVKYDALVINTTALITALATAYESWTDSSGWVVAGLVAYFLADKSAKYGLRVMYRYFPNTADIVQGRPKV